MFFLTHRKIPVPPSVKNVKKHHGSVSRNHLWPQDSVATSKAVRCISLAHRVTVIELVTLPTSTQDRIRRLSNGLTLSTPCDIESKIRKSSPRAIYGVSPQFS